MTHLLFLVAGPSGRPQIAKMCLKKPDKRRQNRRKMSDRNWADPGGPFINLPANKQGSYLIPAPSAADGQADDESERFVWKFGVSHPGSSALARTKTVGGRRGC